MLVGENPDTGIRVYVVLIVARYSGRNGKSSLLIRETAAKATIEHEFRTRFLSRQPNHLKVATFKIAAHTGRQPSVARQTLHMQEASDTHLDWNKVVDVGARLWVLTHSEGARVSPGVKQISDLVVIDLDEVHGKTNARFSGLVGNT